MTDICCRGNKKSHCKPVQVQCDTARVSHMCIFPSDGTGRIRFTGQDTVLSNLSRIVRHPEDYLFCDLFVL